jgi:hypothetical protein
MNKRQHIFLAILIVIINLVTLCTFHHRGWMDLMRHPVDSVANVILVPVTFWLDVLIVIYALWLLFKKLGDR